MCKQWIQGQLFFMGLWPGYMVGIVQLDTHPIMYVHSYPHLQYSYKPTINKTDFMAGLHLSVVWGVSM